MFLLEGMSGKPGAQLLDFLRTDSYPECRVHKRTHQRVGCKRLEKIRCFFAADSFHLASYLMMPQRRCGDPFFPGCFGIFCPQNLSFLIVYVANGLLEALEVS